MPKPQNTTIPGIPVIGAPVIRKRTPVMAKTQQTSDAPSGAQMKEHARRQAEAAKRTREAQGGGTQEEDPNVDTELTTAEHVGKIRQEPHKSRSVEARKVGDNDRTGDPQVKTAPITSGAEGAHTGDAVVAPGNPAGPGGEATSVETPGARVAAARKSSAGKRAGKKTSGNKSGKNARS